MKKTLQILFLGCLLALAGQSFGQTGELTRFTDDELTNNNDIRLYPNPAVEYLKIRIDNSTIQSPKIIVHNIIGNVVEVEINLIGSSEYLVRVEDLSPGYYLVAIRDDQGTFKETYKFLKR